MSSQSSPESRPQHPVPPRLETIKDGQGGVRLSGQWDLAHSAEISRALASVQQRPARIDATAIDALDTLGAMQLMRFLIRQGLPMDAVQWRDTHLALVGSVADVCGDRPPAKRSLGFIAALERLGYGVVDNAREVLALISFLGEVLHKSWRMVLNPRRFRATSAVYHMEQVGLDAVPLVFVLNFLVGAVIAFLGANVLRDFGATIFVVELVNISFLREFAVLLTAIVLAGRTASAFTAQIGAMKSREEVDAMRTIGLDPVDVLVIPRVTALIVMLPLLTFIAMVAGLLGGLTVGALSLDIPPQAYLARMEQTMEIRHFFVGMAKAPIFALVIALIGCLEGLQVKGTAQSVGERTTSSVVQAISLVIVLDAIAAIWYMHLGW